MNEAIDSVLRAGAGCCIRYKNGWTFAASFENGVVGPIRCAINRRQVQGAIDAGVLIPIDAVGPEESEVFVIGRRDVLHARTITLGREMLGISPLGMAHKLGMSLRDYRSVEWGHATLTAEQAAEFQRLVLPVLSVPHLRMQ